MDILNTQDYDTEDFLSKNIITRDMSTTVMPDLFSEELPGISSSTSWNSGISVLPAGTHQVSCLTQDEENAAINLIESINSAYAPPIEAESYSKENDIFVKEPPEKKRKRELPVLNRLNYNDDERISVLEAGICGIESTVYFMEVYQNLDELATLETNIATYFVNKHGFSTVYFNEDKDSSRDVKITIARDVLILTLSPALNRVPAVISMFPSEAIYVTFDSTDPVIDETPNENRGISLKAFMFFFIMNVEDVVLKYREVPGIFPLKKLFNWPARIGKKNLMAKFVQ